jgi:hypothetical protein
MAAENAWMLSTHRYALCVPVPPPSTKRSTSLTALLAAARCTRKAARGDRWFSIAAAGPRITCLRAPARTPRIPRPAPRSPLIAPRPRCALTPARAGAAFPPAAAGRAIGPGSSSRASARTPSSQVPRPTTTTTTHTPPDAAGRGLRGAAGVGAGP